MALSNWDTFAVNEKGEPTTGTLEAFSGIEVSLYKNELLVADAKAHATGSHFSEPIVIIMQHGEIQYKDVLIYATRGPKNGIYVVVESVKYHENAAPERRVMIGIGCYGYADNDEWVGVEAAEINFLKTWLNHGERVVMSTSEGEQESYFTYDFSEEIREIPLDAGLRYNQGDAYFAAHEDGEIPATPPGEATTPVLEQMVKGASEGGEKK